MTVRARPARGRAAMIAAAGTAAIIAGATSGAALATSRGAVPMTLADARKAPVTLGYACGFPSGTYQVDARVTASYPATEMAGRVIRPNSLVLAVNVPAAALTSLGPPGAAVTITARLATSAVLVRSGPNSGAAANDPAPATWVSLAAAPASLPASGQDLGSGPLRPTAPLPPLTAARAGTMTVTAGSLALRFSPARANTGATATPSASATPTASVTPGATAIPSGPEAANAAPVRAPAAATCTPDLGQDAVLAAIAVRGAPVTQAARHAPYCPPFPRGGLKLNPRLPKPPLPPGSVTGNFPPALGCAYIMGYSDVLKSDSAALIGPSLLNLAVGVRTVGNAAGTYYQEDSAGQLNYQQCSTHRNRRTTCEWVHGFPPANATFVDFGFVPVTATLVLTEIGTINIYSSGPNDTLSTNISWSLMELRVYNVKVNGQPLNVGNDCETEKPLLIGLTGLASSSPPYSIDGGGPLSGEVAIQPFTNCGVGENLDNLLTGTVSGADNYSTYTQGVVCQLTNNDQDCPPQRPKPLR
jgi:hypothetical protein